MSIAVEIEICNVDCGRTPYIHCRLRSKSGYVMSIAVEVGVCNINSDQSRDAMSTAVEVCVYIVDCG